jgi:hypothetical protein
MGKKNKIKKKKQIMDLQNILPQRLFPLDLKKTVSVHHD